jgi:hypothetical protein
MFGRGKSKGPVANKLTDEAEPNKLSWVASDAEAGGVELDYDQFVEEEELAEDEEEDEEDEQTLAQRRADLEAELARQAEEFGLTGSNPTAIYGPNGEDVEAVLDALSAIDTEQAEQLADAWAAGDATERDVLERDLLRRSRVGKHGYELTAAEDAVAAWLNAQTPEDDDDAAFWAMVAGAARGAVDALILDEELDDADYDTLYGPWAEVMDTEGEDGGTGDREREATGGGPARDTGRSTDEPDGEFGPNTELVRQFLVKLDELTPDQAGELTAFWNGQSKADLRQAHRAMQALANEDEAWREQIRAAQDEITTWTNGPHTVKALRQDRALAAEIAARVAALPPAVDAISALVLADLLEPEDAETLYAAWDATVGEPKLPEYEEDGEEQEAEPKPKSGGKPKAGKPKSGGKR